MANSFIDRIKEPKLYIKNGKQCYLDVVSKQLRIKTPEETVRQMLILYMNKQMRVPLDAIEVEVPLARFKKGVKGRMDLVVYGTSDGYQSPVMIFECKAPSVLLTDEVFKQADNYAEVVGSPFVGVTNGIDFVIDHWNGKKYQRVEGLPKYKDLCDPYKLKMIDILPDKYERNDYIELNGDNVYKKALDEFIIGSLTPREYVPLIMNIHDCLMDDSVLCEGINIKGYTSVTDMGKRFTKFGNAAGGGYPGEYRYFLLCDSNGDSQIASIGVFSYSERYTIILVAIDDYENSNSALQLNIELNVFMSGNDVEIWHNGRMAVGNIGSARSSDVISYVAEKSTHLVVDDKIYLGKLDNSKLLYINSDEATEFLGRIIEYAFLRNEYRAILKSRKKK